MSSQDMQREQALAEIVAGQLGIDLFRFPGSTIEALLRHLPCPTDRSDAQADAALLSAIEARLAVGETSFLRRRSHFDALPQIVRQMPATNTPRRVWSAGCSTGEEAYSLATVLPQAAIFATDVRKDAIEQARLGRYRTWSLREMDREPIPSWIERHGEVLEVRAALTQRIDFQVHNLVHDPYPQDFDVIFCRNVLLYFRTEIATAVLARLVASLRPHGVLFLGDFDPLPPLGETLREESLGDATFYRHVPAVHCQADAETVDSETRDAQPAVAVQRFAVAMEQARKLSNQKATADGLALLDQLTVAFPLAVEPHVLTVLLSREANAPQDALEAARRACFLAPEQPITHYLMAVCLLDVEEPVRARPHLHTASALLSAIADRQSPLRYGEGLTANQLKRMIDGHQAEP